MNSGRSHDAVRYEEIEDVLPSFMVLWNLHRGDGDGGVAGDAVVSGGVLGFTKEEEGDENEGESKKVREY